jgi:acetylornithine deacetylase
MNSKSFDTATYADAKRLLEPLQHEVVPLAAALVQANTVNVPPYGTETAGQSVLRDFFSAHGIDAELYSLDFLGSCSHPYKRPDRDYAGRQNLSVRLTGSGRGKSLLLNGHMDTVPPGRSAWTHPPWSGYTQGGRLYGLGALDMKGGIAAQAAAVAAVRKAGVSLAGDLLMQSVVDEEWGGGGGTLAALLRGETADAAVISEATQLQVWRATRGGFVVDLEVHAGDPAKYFSGEPLVSPALPLSRLLQWIESWVNERADHAPVQVLAIESNRLDREVPLSVPLMSTVRVYFQFLPDENVDEILSTVQESLGEWQRTDPFYRTYPIRWKPLYNPPLLGHELPESHEWTQCLASAVSGVSGRPATVAAGLYPSDAFLLHREFGIPTLLFGPSGAGAHNPDEFVEIDSILKTAESLLSAALMWCL